MSTTLGIVIFTTLVCGGLTEPILNRTGMRTAKEEGATGASTVTSSSTHNSLHSAAMHSGSGAGADVTQAGAAEAVEDSPMARTATSTSFIEMLSGVTNRAHYEVSTVPFIITSISYNDRSNFLLFSCMLSICHQRKMGEVARTALTALQAQAL